MTTTRTPDLGAMDARLARLERDNRRLRRGGAAALALAGAAILMGQAEGDKVWNNLEARRIALIGPGGNVRAELGTTKDGHVRFDFYNDADGRVASLTTDGPFLGFYDNAGVRQVGLAVGEGAHAYLSFKGKDGKERVLLTEDGTGPRLTLSDEAGAPRAILGSALVKEPETGKMRNYPPSSLKLFDRTGSLVFSAPPLK